ncbi:Ring finger domain [Popillia japonica]|uniref:E3 ubiquitin-protein ligase ZNRF1 n=1 Tax=Popillia japonica TaxID=7064 RepID=A0AAW1JWB0_POPJA
MWTTRTAALKLRRLSTRRARNGAGVFTGIWGDKSGLDLHCVGIIESGVKGSSEREIKSIKCPVCSKFVIPDDIECHLVMCLTKPRLSYNEDVLTDDKGECVICLEDLSQGDVIARLPCLCIYHKGCIDQWFEINRSCPEHPGD